LPPTTPSTPPAGGDDVEAAQGEDIFALGGACDNVALVGTLAFAGVGVLVAHAVALHAERIGNSAHHKQHRRSHGCH
jgi:hypothetical protein